jgi:glycerate kinase
MARIVIAPDSFKGSADAAAVAAALAQGWASERPEDEIRLMPMADGGEGTLDAFAVAVPGSVRHPVEVTGPDGRTVSADWLWLPEAGNGEAGNGEADEADESGGTGVVELASTSGLTLLEPLQPLDAHTIGFGEAIVAALDFGVRRLILAIGGSSSTDGGAGALTALGARFDDATGHPIAPGSRGLSEVASASFTAMRRPPGGGVVVVSDVTSPLYGETGAAHVFGAQKGADAGTRRAMDENLRKLADIVPVDPTTSGAGAAGGTGFGLLAWGETDGETGGVSIVPGARSVADAMGLTAAIDSADLVITGEGRFDDQSEVGKVPAYVAELATSHGGRPVLLVAGSIAAPTGGFADSADLSVLAGSVELAIAEPLTNLRLAGAGLARSYSRTLATRAS